MRNNLFPHPRVCICTWLKLGSCKRVFLVCLLMTGGTTNLLQPPQIQFRYIQGTQSSSNTPGLVLMAEKFLKLPSAQATHFALLPLIFLLSRRNALRYPLVYCSCTQKSQRTVPQRFYMFRTFPCFFPHSELTNEITRFPV